MGGRLRSESPADFVGMRSLIGVIFAQAAFIIAILQYLS
jgi:hypothetical protein